MAAAVRFALLGTGNSTGVPWLQCVINSAKRCFVCADCVANPASRNRRNNPSALVSFDHPDGRRRHILIDVGKTFRDTVQRSFPALGVDHIDAVILTHAHMDAFGGLDDLRDISPHATLPVYLSQTCFDVVSRTFAYLVKKPETAGLFVASLDWRIVTPWTPFEVEGLLVTPLPVEHGPPGPMLGFEFSALDERVFGGGGGSDSAVGSSLSSMPSAETRWRTPPPAGDGAPAAEADGHVHSGSCCGPAENGGDDAPPRPRHAGPQGAADGGAADAPDAALAHRVRDLSLGAASAPAAAAAAAVAPDGSVPASAPAAGGGGGQRIVYISDIAALPSDTRAFLKDGRRIDLLVLDALSYASYPTHFGFKQSVACALDLHGVRDGDESSSNDSNDSGPPPPLRPGSTVFVGMNHRVDYYAESPKLAAFGRRYGVDLQLGYDGWAGTYTLAALGTAASVGAAADAARARVHAIPPPPFHAHAVPHLMLTAGPVASHAAAAAGLDVAAITSGAPLGRDELPGTLPPAAEAPASASTHAPTAFTYKDALLPEWEDGQSPSKSAGVSRV